VSSTASAANRVLDRCGSTNDLARELGEQGASHGTWVSARIQEQGRGRLGRQWQSLEGNLFLSVIARIPDKTVWTWVPMTTAIAIARCLSRRYPELPIRIKWPNDLWIHQSKLGGILCEAVGNRHGSFIVIGLGVNCAHAPQGLDQETISLTRALSRSVVADDVRSEIISSLLEALDELQTRGTSGIVRDYERWAALPPGSSIEWTQPSDPSAPPKAGVVRGLGPSGELIVAGAEGEQKLYAEDVKIRKASGESPA
jgi:BirA family biotin operon repressor/biotin-[acetyl-CoA-carboxylase] ligase